MTSPTTHDARISKYTFEVDINASADRVWTALIDHIGDWWLPDFHMVDPSSTVSLDARPGGGLLEMTDEGAGLLWYTVQLIQPSQRVVYLVGHVAPDWGGPTTSHLKFAVESRGDGAVLHVSDAHQGSVDETNIASLEEGWRRLMTDGLKAWVEEAG